MKETGLMFKAPLVRAILCGQKTQTRRLFKAPNDGVWPNPNDKPGMEQILRSCPLGQPGDRIYVRETFVQGYEYDPVEDRLRTCDEEGNDLPMKTWFRATDPGVTWCDDDGWEVNAPWSPAIHMPKSLARIWLEVTGVRVERLQDISEADAAAEGCETVCMTPTGDDSGSAIYGPGGFAELWDSTTGRPALPTNTASKRYARIKQWLDTHPDTVGWAANPWVWVINFKHIETPKGSAA